MEITIRDDVEKRPYDSEKHADYLEIFHREDGYVLKNTDNLVRNNTRMLDAITEAKDFDVDAEVYAVFYMDTETFFPALKAVCLEAHTGPYMNTDKASRELLAKRLNSWFKRLSKRAVRLHEADRDKHLKVTGDWREALWEEWSWYSDLGVLIVETVLDGDMSTLSTTAENKWEGVHGESTSFGYTEMCDFLELLTGDSYGCEYTYNYTDSISLTEDIQYIVQKGDCYEHEGFCFISYHRGGDARNVGGAYEYGLLDSSEGFTSELISRGAGDLVFEGIDYDTLAELLETHVDERTYINSDGDLKHFVSLEEGALMLDDHMWYFEDSEQFTLELDTFTDYDPETKTHNNPHYYTDDCHTIGSGYVVRYDPSVQSTEDKLYECWNSQEFEDYMRIQEHFKGVRAKDEALIVRYPEDYMTDHWMECTNRYDSIVEPFREARDRLLDKYGAPNDHQIKQHLARRELAQLTQFVQVGQAMRLNKIRVARGYDALFHLKPVFGKQSGTSWYGTHRTDCYNGQQVVAVDGDTITLRNGYAEVEGDLIQAYIKLRRHNGFWFDDEEREAYVLVPCLSPKKAKAILEETLAKRKKHEEAQEAARKLAAEERNPKIGTKADA